MSVGETPRWSADRNIVKDCPNDECGAIDVLETCDGTSVLYECAGCGADLGNRTLGAEP